MDPNIIASGIEYLYQVPSKTLTGDVFAVSLILIVSYLAVLAINKLTDMIIFFLKKAILLVIVSLAFYQFAVLLAQRFQTEGITTEVLLFGGFGLLTGTVAIIIAFQAAFSSLRKAEKEETSEEPKKETHGEKKMETGGMFSAENLRKDRSIGIVLAYLIVAEFGVLSSKTVAAPTVFAGALFFFAFMAAAIFFVHQGYNDPKVGMRHFILAFFLGGALSIILGITWGGYALEEMLSPTYFVSDSLVAFVTGIAVSLFMGSKG